MPSTRTPRSQRTFSIRSVVGAPTPARSRANSIACGVPSTPSQGAKTWNRGVARNAATSSADPDGALARRTWLTCTCISVVGTTTAAVAIDSSGSTVRASGPWWDGRSKVGTIPSIGPRWVSAGSAARRTSVASQCSTPQRRRRTEAARVIPVVLHETTRSERLPRPAS